MRGAALHEHHRLIPVVDVVSIEIGPVVAPSVTFFEKITLWA